MIEKISPDRFKKVQEMGIELSQKISKTIIKYIEKELPDHENVAELTFNIISEALAIEFHLMAQSLNEHERQSYLRFMLIKSIELKEIADNGKDCKSP